MHKKTWTRLRKGKFKIETEYLLIAAHINAIRTNQIKARIYQTYKNRKCKLCDDRVKTSNHISESSKLTQKEYKTRLDRVGKVMYKKFKFDHRSKWYMHNPAVVLENETHKLL